MTFFSKLYSWMLSWAAHPKASRLLAAVSFAESSFFPIPPDVMLIPMSLAKPRKAIYYASITTVFSILGGIFGYFIGMYAAHWLLPWIHDSHYHEAYTYAEEWFKNWGVWVVLIAGFSPIPYKLFTIAAGALYMPFLPFVFASFLGRGGRFFLVSALLYQYGEAIESKLRSIIDIVGWLAVLFVVCAYIYLKCF